MRIDRNPPPIRHHHGPVTAGTASTVNHSEPPSVLRRLRACPNFRGCGPRASGHLSGLVREPERRVVIPVRPGSIVVT
ncbi:MAG: hypothetical protein R2851_27995 [Caldilineaceae bacterium]